MKFISNNTFLWRSEKEGYDNFYLYNTEGELIKKVLNRKHVVKDYFGYNMTIYIFLHILMMD